MPAPASSQPAYEELKPEILPYAAVVLGGSQPTYEELKLRHPSPAWAAPACSQPTYEELKPDILRYL